MPIQFACPYCSKQTTVADQYAGQSGPCSGCGKTVTIPFAAGPTLGGPSAQSGGGGGAGTVLAIVGVVLLGGVLLCGGLGALLIYPMFGQVRSSAQRAASTNNLRQIGLAIHSYHDAYGAFPPAIVKDKDGKPLYSGMVLLLPFLEQDNLFQQFDKSKAWDDPANEFLQMVSIPTLMNPASTNASPGRCDYLLVGGPNAVLADNGQPSKMTMVLDGTSNTIMAVEAGPANAPKSWTQPVAWDSTQSFDSPHPNVVNVLFADGSVRALPKSTPAQTLRLLSDRQDGQVVNIP